MKLVVIALILLLLGCKSNNLAGENPDGFDIGRVLSYMLENGNIDRDVPIVNQLKTIDYYTREYSEDSLLFPPPSPFAINEEDIIEWVDSEYFPKDSITKVFVRDQLIYLNENRSPTQLVNSDLKLRKFEKSWPGRCYIFYKPIFNQDSSAFILQHDEYYGYFGGGGIHLLVKENDKWLVEKYVHRWEN
ncbi:hypothetical protein DFQ04_0187 [Algoriphagus boseongensis]|uniref:Lipoprotein n=1 Tax=Algoriphagus boseongensis TaxID=1442587 RepID=A0A4R6T5L2_9BACT|nr:hypothetical protein [Algoriphagus boseongensis]TDQ18388.1 hypothetical protein DFQ04_0187 [Algoriphagus boseongensis]